MKQFHIVSLAVLAGSCEWSYWLSIKSRHATSVSRLQLCGIAYKLSQLDSEVQTYVQSLYDDRIEVIFADRVHFCCSCCQITHITNIESREWSPLPAQISSDCILGSAQSKHSCSWPCILLPNLLSVVVKPQKVSVVFDTKHSQKHRRAYLQPPACQCD